MKVNNPITYLGVLIYYKRTLWPHIENLANKSADFYTRLLDVSKLGAESGNGPDNNIKEPLFQRSLTLQKYEKEA